MLDPLASAAFADPRYRNAANSAKSILRMPEFLILCQIQLAYWKEQASLLDPDKYKTEEELRNALRDNRMHVRLWEQLQQSAQALASTQHKGV